ncbi:MAG: tetratricopeptide repeat protein, partial [Planctomycetes bacterium]|nr:tetratricopeptide repeat protein [Planctomycetota bacterium]
LDLVAWGRPGEGRAELLELMAMSRKINDPRPHTMAQWALASLNAFSGDCDEGIENAEEALRTGLCPVDRYNAEAYRSIAMILSGQVGTGMTIGNPLYREVTAKGFFMVFTHFRMILGVGLVLQGQMASGIKVIKEAISEATSLNQSTPKAFGNMVLGETYLQIATSSEKPPLRTLLRNMGFLARTLPFVKSKARGYLSKAYEEFSRKDCPSYAARCLFNLGQLDRFQNQTEAAQVKFEKAREIANAVEATHLVREIEGALATPISSSR